TSLVIEDALTGRWHAAQSRLHLHPDVDTDVGADGSVKLHVGGCTLRVHVEGGALALEDTTWHPRFGASVPTRCLVARFHGAKLRLALEVGDSASLYRKIQS